VFFSKRLSPAVPEYQSHADGWHQTTHRQRQAVSSPIRKEERATGDAEKQTCDRARECCQDRQHGSDTQTAGNQRQ
jgi:hypothetical protein